MIDFSYTLEGMLEFITFFVTIESTRKREIIAWKPNGDGHKDQ
jgi:hypothetical protein